MNENYPRLIKRIKAALIDSIVLPASYFGMLSLIISLGVDSTVIKVATFISTLIILEPVLVSTTGGTIGHHLVKLKIRRIEEDKLINIWTALVRFVLKIMLGIPSILYMLVSTKHQAIHDIVAKSIVVYKSNSGIHPSELLAERSRNDEQVNYLKKSRRIGIIAIYWIVFYVILSLVSTVFISFDCSINDKCSNAEIIIILSILAILLLGFIIITTMGWRGKLYGCRKIHNV